MFSMSEGLCAKTQGSLNLKFYAEFYAELFISEVLTCVHVYNVELEMIKCSLGSLKMIKVAFYFNDKSTVAYKILSGCIPTFLYCFNWKPQSPKKFREMSSKLH